ncbi:DUF1036 domain-containing protein [Flavobacterium sp.]|uniref:DUF1036 domain-containing protein n=1 Tax=Flavobacterium sp. TaxID=239 RepID=UPI0025F49C38|nr:DUF1036 domain-containing protein [Flavobacterium sp.]
MKKVFFILLFTIFMVSSKSYGKTTICEITFFTDNIKYDCLMVLNDLSSYGNNYMRVAYTINGNYIVINQQLSVEKQLLADGNTYITASGYNVRFITNSLGHTYNPDKLSVLINAAGVIDQPKIGDSRNAMMPVSSFRDVSNASLDYNYLKRFFVDGEPELYSLSVSSFGNQLQIQTPKPNSIQNATSIEFYNNTGSEISACYAYYNNNDRCWTSVGWYTIPAYSYKSINIGNYSGNVYIRGRQGLATEWGSGDGQFCVDATQAFNIKFADTKDCWSKKKFSKFFVVSGVNKWTFN